jgi:electron transport complex protein RnfG
MVGIGVLCALLIVVTFQGTLPRIERLRAEALAQAVFKVLPGTKETRTYYFEDGQFKEMEGDISNVTKVYAGFDQQGQLTGVAVEASGQGYADILRILYGYEPASQSIIGFHVLESKETPGLGDKIEKDADFLLNFGQLDVSLTDDSKQLKNAVVPVKQGEKQHPWEVDGITGATISSRAIGNIIGASTQQWVPLIYQQVNDFQLNPDSGP